MMLSAVLAAALSTAFVSPCDVATDADAAALLHTAPIPVPASEMGEETAPSCIWATKGRASEVKISVWSPDELPVVGMADAAAYYAKRKADAEAATVVADTGDQAFASFSAPRKGLSSGEVVVLMGDRLVAFEFGSARASEAKAYVAAVMRRIQN
ncbi:MAG: hypothetical protein ACKVRO_04130 [Micropepsaceae bacterium]